jgi:hypothetical protein
MIAAFQNALVSVGKKITTRQTVAAEAKIDQAMVAQMKDLKKTMGTLLIVDRLKLSSTKHGNIRFTVKATTYKDDRPMIAKLKGLLRKGGDVTFKEIKVTKPASGGMLMGASPESGGALSRPTGEWNAYQNIPDQNRLW